VVVARNMWANKHLLMNEYVNDHWCIQTPTVILQMTCPTGNTWPVRENRKIY